MAINYPPLCVEDTEKLGFVKRALKLLYKEHGTMGVWFHPDKQVITLTRYQKLRPQVKSRWPYTGEKLSKAEWDKYFKERFDIKHERLISEKCFLESKLENSDRFSPNIDDDIE